MSTDEAGLRIMKARNAALFDLLGLMVFVAIGRREHDVHNGFVEYLATLWPFVAGWFAVAVATRLYGAPLDWRRSVPTWFLAVPLAMWLRVAFTGHAFFVAFTIVSWCFLALVLLGWRAGVLVYRRAVSRRSESSNAAA
jgi:DUF3054 family protein